MTDDRQGNGRRAGDALFWRGLKIAGGVGTFVLIALTLAFKLYSQMLDFPQLTDRVSALETSQQQQARVESVKLFMLCGLYRKSYPEQVPALCDDAISRSAPR